MTVQILFCSASISFIVGLFFGVLTCERLKRPGLSHLIEGITFVLRGVPFYVFLLIVYFVLPELIGYNLGPLTASVIALSGCSSGYVAQLVRGGINSIAPVQWETAATLGCNTWQSLIYVILPQTFRVIVPSLNNEFDALLKSTAIVSTIGVLELTRMGMNVVSREMEPVPIYLLVAVFYITISALMNVVKVRLEKKLAYVKT